MQYQEKRGTTAGTGTGQDGESRKRKRDADGKEEGSGKKEKKDARAAAAATEIEKDAERKGLDAPKILPGEKLSDFAARVDRELPLSAMKKSIRPAGSDVPDIREQRLTKHDKRLKQLQRQWREEEERIREREEEERDEREAGMEDQTELWRQWETEAGKKKKRKGSAAAKRKTGGNDSDSADDPDPWAKLNNRDRLNKPVNPFDVAQAPPQLNKAKGKFKVSGGARVDVANVPAAVGSLRRREELAGERRNIVEEYRRLMAEKRK